ncbi:hypothetical protein D8B26_005388 [Coccidioides posadasii str. Silveira]|uniref:uncharacterized protein n=1 Tax=Coccidioides posadasii (strain RMSCC 757 / Silveira) TaxID=443226 RepID=UPI001BF0EEA9|nr:hypothetical protein D8B26_005388 [Coccidioides posadasii str. Silveira]
MASQTTGTLSDNISTELQAKLKEQEQLQQQALKLEDYKISERTGCKLKATLLQCETFAGLAPPHRNNVR